MSAEAGGARGDECASLANLASSFFISPLLSQDVSIPMDHTTGTHRGFGIVEFEEAGDAAAAIENLDGGELCGRVLRVNHARPQVGGKGGGGGGAGGGGAWADEDAWQDAAEAEKAAAAEAAEAAEEAARAQAEVKEVGGG